MRTGLPNETSVFDSRTTQELYEEVREVYRRYPQPWVIGYSGGKDSTATLQLVWKALEGLPPEERNKPVYVIASDTQVETPVIIDYLDSTIERINEAAKAQDLPITAQKVSPDLNGSFWVNLIGRGYPAPTSRFRWCTERMKILPANRFIEEKVAQFGEVIMVLGVRKSESATRMQLMNTYEVKGQFLRRHTSLPGAYVYAPVSDFSTDDVWTYLLQVPNPWGSNNRDLAALYRNASAGECPLVVDTSTPSCGGSRFGCWVCTVVQRDTSMEALIDNGEDWMEPLLEFRDELAETSDPARKREFRDIKGRDGRIVLKKDGTPMARTYKFEYSKYLLERLLRVQEEVRRNGPDPDRHVDLRRGAARDPPHLAHRAARLGRFRPGDIPAGHRSRPRLAHGRRRPVRLGPQGPPGEHLQRVRGALRARGPSAGSRAARQRDGSAREHQEDAGHRIGPGMEGRGRVREGRAAEVGVRAFRGQGARVVPDLPFPLEGSYPWQTPMRYSRRWRTVKLLSLTVENIGVFRGRHHFDLGPATEQADGEGRPLTVISGRNGAGKSTLFQALGLALHGSLALGDRVSQETYRKFLLGRLHRGQDATASESSSEGGVALAFVYVRSGRPLRIEVERRWRRAGRGIEETLSVLEDGSPPDVEEAEYQTWLNDFVPPGLAPLCFFDAERLDALATPERHDELLRDIFGRLLGLDLVGRLQEDLKNYTLSRGGGQKVDFWRKEVLQHQADVEVLKAQQEQLKAEAESVDAHRSELEAELAKQERRLASEGGGYAARRAALQEKFGAVQAGDRGRIGAVARAQRRPPAVRTWCPSSARRWGRDWRRKPKRTARASPGSCGESG